ncbi:hypothetical protein B5M42_011605 [Paenibacillus athensensis]|uniref:Uncharacterized protein n=1 Tax=Paenibacillus athensensis TaxID=1967502 RepID=A0A4Y8Q6A4_9BACL|nr:hypothetical protein [Paenibacillus athensensis]MCD1259480.1 hypothetical protein [Paenibacillus athensensis]
MIIAKLSVFYDFFEEGLRPQTLFVRFADGELDWSKSMLYIPVQAPFQKMESEDMEELDIGLGVELDDLTINRRYPQRFGINLKALAARHASREIPLERIRQLIVRICDIEETMQTEPNSLYRRSAT